MATKKYLSYDGLQEYDDLIKAYADSTAANKADKDHAHDLYETKNNVDTKISTHNTATDTHNDIRDLITGLTTRLNTLADSDDTTLDQMSEVAAYIKSNKDLIDAITTNKVSVSDIVDNLTTNVSNKPLSAAQGVALKTLIDGLTAADVGLGNVDNTSDANKPVSTLQAEAIADAKKAGTDAQNNLTVHNTATDAHADIRSAVSTAQTRADAAYSLAESKQPKITGTAGQFVVIGDDGNVTTKTVPYAEEASF